MKNRLKEIRAQKKMTQETLAAKAKISRTSLALIETEKTTPDGETIAKLVKALEMPASDIFFDLGVV